MYHNPRQSQEKENTTAGAPSRPNILHGVAANQFWPESAHRQMSGLLDEMMVRDASICELISNNQDIPKTAGFIAEEIHAETFNLQAILRDKTARALTGKNSQAFFKNNDSMKVRSLMTIKSAGSLSQDRVICYSACKPRYMPGP